MTTKNKKELLNEELLDTDLQENTEKVSKWQEIKELSKEKYNEIVTDLKNPIKVAVMKRKAGTKVATLLRGFLFIGLAFVIVFPIFQQLTLSVRHPIDLNNKLVNWIPENYSVFNFQLSAILLDYWDGLLCNIKVSTISTICQLFATSLAGYAFSRLKFRGSNIIFWLVMLTLIVPPQAVSLSRTFYLGDFDILAFGDNPGLFESFTTYFIHTCIVNIIPLPYECE